jgi:two-component system, sensor histidine kinase and response regulator
VQMPGLDGYQATAAIRALPERSQVPIIALTAHAMSGDREKCLSAGMNEYMAKPLDIRKLVEIVEACGSSAVANHSRLNPVN